MVPLWGHVASRFPFSLIRATGICMPALVLVMIGGAIGAGARHVAGRAVQQWTGSAFPWGTLSVNVVGSLLMGLLIGYIARGDQGGEQLRLLLGVGVLGGFTTFSAFSLEIVQLLQRGDWVSGLGYIVISVIGSVAAVATGLTLVKAVA